jgi:hypothetical protein
MNSYERFFKRCSKAVTLNDSLKRNDCWNASIAENTQFFCRGKIGIVKKMI